MTWQTIFYLSSVFITCLLTGFLTWYAWKHREVPGSSAYARLALAECLLVLTEILSVLSPSMGWALFWFQTRYITGAFISVFWFVFALEYSGRREWLSKSLLAGLFIIPFVTQILQWSNREHGLWMKQEAGIYQNGPFWIADITTRIPGLGYLTHSFYTLFLTLAGIVLMLMTAWKLRRKLVAQALLLAGAGLTALFIVVNSLFNLLPKMEFNIFTPGIGLSVLLIALAVFRFEFLKRAPAQESTSQVTRLNGQEKQSLAIFILIFGLLVSGSAAVSIFTYRNYEEHFIMQVKNQLSSIGAMKTAELQNWRNERLADADLFYQNENFSKRVQDYLDNPTDVETQSNLLTWMTKIQASPEYDRIILLDAQGVERASIPATPEEIPQNLVEQASISLDSRQIVFLDFHRHSDSDTIHMSMVVPIFTAQDQPLGALVLRINPNVNLYPFIQRWPIPSQSAETLLVRRDGNDALFLNELKFEQGAALNRRISLKNETITEVKALLGVEGSVEGVDYRSVPVIADVRAVPGSSWFLVSKVDTAEVYAPLQTRLWQTILVFGVLILLAGAGLVLIWRQGQMTYLQLKLASMDALDISEKKFRLAFDTSPDSIAISRLKDGMYVSVNRGFEQISGFSREEVLGKTSLEIDIWKDPADRQKVVETLQIARQINNYDASFLTPNGERHCLLSAAIIELNGEPHILNIARDITERKRVEDALRESEALYRAILNASPDDITITDLEGRIIMISRSALSMFGYDREDELLGHPASDFIAPEDRERALSKLGTLTGPLEYRGLRKDGSTFDTEINVELIPGPDGQPTSMIFVVRDITERKRAEVMLRKLSSAVEQSPVSIVITDLLGNIEYVNPRFSQITGYSLEEAIKKNPRILKSGYTSVEEYDTLWDTITSGNQWQGEFLNIKKNGETYWEYATIAPVFDPNGKVTNFLAIKEDITERKQAENALRDSEENLNKAQHYAHVGSWTWNIKTNQLKWSDEMYHIFGIDKAAFTGNLADVIAQVIHPDDRDKVEQSNRSVSEQGKPIALEYRIVRQDGTIRVVWGEAGELIFDDSGNPSLLSGIVQDITERKQVEEELLKSEQKYRLLFDEMMSGIAIHEIICDKRGKPVDYRFIAINAAFEKLTGLHAAAVIGKNVLEVMPGTEAYWIERYGQVALTRIPIQFENYSGELDKYFEVRAFSPEHGKFATIFNDITERRKAEIEIQERTEDLELINALNESANRGDNLDKIMLVFTTALRRISVCENSTIYLLSPDGKNLIMQTPGLPPTLIKKIEQVIGKRLPQVEIPIQNDSFFQRALQAEQGTITTDPGVIQNWMQEFTEAKSLPAAIRGATRKLIPQIYKLLDIGSTMVIPLFSDKKVIGLLDISSSEILTEKDLQRIRKISGQLTAVILREQANAALLESEERYRSIFDGVQDAIFVETKDGGVLEVNNRACEMYGYPRDEFLSKKVADLVPEGSTTFTLSDMQSNISHKPLETFNRRASGEIFPIEISGGALSINSEELLLVVVRETTERKQAEEVIHQRMTELELLYENSLAFSQLLSPKEVAQKIIELLEQKMDWHHTTIHLANEKDESLELLALDQRGLEGKTENRTILANLREAITCFDKGLSGWALQQSKIVRCGDVSGDPHYVEFYPGIRSGLYVPLKSGDRRLGVISIESEKPDAFSEADEQLISTLANQAAIAFENARLYEEINRYTEELEQRVQERTAEIEATEQRLELAVQTAGIGIWEVDVKTNVEYWDDRLFSLYGLSSQTSLPAPETWYKAIHPDDLHLQMKLMNNALNNNELYTTEFRVVWPDASIHYIRSTGIVIHDAAGVPERMIGANQDITLHKQAEETLRLANAEMERGLRMKNEFLANMSHELRTPLNAILGISESLEEQISGKLNEKQLKYIHTVIESGRHLLELINDVLDLSKIEAGKLDIDIQPISVEKLCASSLRLIKELAQKKSLNVSLKIDEKVQFIAGDERRLKQSLVNLLGNAVKFTPQDKNIGLEVKGNAQANEITLTVWDEGIGIEGEEIQYLFQPFVQLNAGLAREFAGTGLGLALVAQMVRLHGGRIDLTSEIQAGSRFIITLPWLPKEQEMQSSVQPQALNNLPMPKAIHTGKILIVEDTEVVAQLMSEYLQHQGYETIVATNGQEGIMLARQELPQLILMDVMMPIMNGLEATKHIRADAAIRDIPIIGLTALAMSSDREECLAAGMNDHLSKPIQMQDLVKTIEHHLH